MTENRPKDRNIRDLPPVDRRPSGEAWPSNPRETPKETIDRLRQRIDDLTMSRDHFRELYDTAPVGYLTLGENLVVDESNRTAAAMLGVPRLIGAGLQAFVSPEHRKRFFRLIRRTRDSRRRQTCDLMFRRMDDARLFVRIESVASIDSENGTTICRLVLIDMTERRKAEDQFRRAYEQLQAAVRAAGIGIWNYDLEKGTSRWNEQLYHLLGQEPRQGPEPAERFFEFIHPEDRAGNIAGLQSVLAQKEDELNTEFRINRSDGQIRWLAARGRIYRDERGRPVRISGINFDISERKQVEETVRLAQIHLAAQLVETERVNEELSQYAYAVSHDLKAPLRAIRNYADFLYEDLADTLTGEQRKYIDGLKTALDQGNALIRDLLSFSRIGRVPLEVEPADIPDIVKEIRSALDFPSHVEIAVQPQWPEFRADRTLLKQILQNLITNGIKFNDSRVKRIDIGWTPAPDDCIEIFVRDNGVGIEPQFRQQIFRIFQRLHTQHEHEGTGIGLAIVQKAAQKLGGEVRLASEPGKGSTFCVKLPR